MLGWGAEWAAPTRKAWHLRWKHVRSPLHLKEVREGRCEIPFRTQGLHRIPRCSLSLIRKVASVLTGKCVLKFRKEILSGNEMLSVKRFHVKRFDSRMFSALHDPRQCRIYKVEEILVFSFLSFSSLSDRGSILFPPSFCGLWYGSLLFQNLSF